MPQRGGIYHQFMKFSITNLSGQRKTLGAGEILAAYDQARCRCEPSCRIRAFGQRALAREVVDNLSRGFAADKWSQFFNAGF